MPHHPLLKIVLRRDFIAGAMFIAIAAFGLWLSRAYPVGTALRMSTGYMPRLLCWLLMALGAGVLLQSLWQRDEPPPIGETAGENSVSTWWPVLIVPASLTAFGLGLERLGLVVSIVLLIAIASLAGRGLRLIETIGAAIVLAILSWLIFILGLGLAMPVWPDFS